MLKAKIDEAGRLAADRGGTFYEVICPRKEKRTQCADSCALFGEVEEGIVAYATEKQDVRNGNRLEICEGKVFEIVE